MDCTNCAITITRYLQKEGLKNVKVNFIGGEVSFELNSGKSKEIIEKGIRDLGYQVLNENSAARQQIKSRLFTNHLQRFLFCLPFTLVLLLHMLPWHLPLLMDPYIQLLICLPVYFTGMSYFGVSAFKSLKRGIPNMNVLIALGATAAFIYSLADDDLQIKRDLEGPGEAVRVMTVHGAKGLEAKIVILPDTCGVPDPRKLSRLHYLGSPPMLAVAAGKAEDCAVLRAARDAACRAADEEHRRLLYVALTRAEERLYIAGHANGELPDGSWYKMIEATLGATLQPEPAFWDSGDTVWRGVDPPPPGLRSSEEETRASDHDAALPAWLEQRVADAGPAMPQFLRASGEAFDSQGDSRRGRALARGDRIHDLLSRLAALPPEARTQGGERLLASRNADLDASEARKLLDQALAVIALPELAALFGAGSQAEVELVGNVAFDDGQVEAVVGRVDRMALADGLVVYADFKSGTAPVGLPPPAYLLQLARYGAILGQIYPGKPRRALLVWTDSLRVDDVSGDVLAAALASHASRTAPASRQTTRP